LTWLDLSFNRITHISGLDTLTKLVDLSLFNNQITKIENLDKLTELNVLSLGARVPGQLAAQAAYGMRLMRALRHAQPGIASGRTRRPSHICILLRAGNNHISQIDNVMYLRQFRNLRLVILAGNPICKDHDYRSYVLSHIKDLVYLDYRRVNPTDVTAAREQHQVLLVPVQPRARRPGRLYVARRTGSVATKWRLSVRTRAALRRTR
jgi:hypothetical protein